MSQSLLSNRQRQRFLNMLKSPLSIIRLDSPIYA